MSKDLNRRAILAGAAATVPLASTAAVAEPPEQTMPSYSRSVASSVS